MLLKVQLVLFIFFATVASEIVFSTVIMTYPRPAQRGLKTASTAVQDSLPIQCCGSQPPHHQVMIWLWQTEKLFFNNYNTLNILFLLYSKITALAVVILCRTDQFNMIGSQFLSWPLTSADSSYIATQWKVIKRVVVLRAWCNRSSSVVTRYS